MNTPTSANARMPVAPRHTACGCASSMWGFYVEVVLIGGLRFVRRRWACIRHGQHVEV